MHSNTTLVKVKLDRTYYFKNGKAYSNTTLVKVKFSIISCFTKPNTIQIQHLLKLNAPKKILILAI